MQKVVSQSTRHAIKIIIQGSQRIAINQLFGENIYMYKFGIWMILRNESEFIGEL